MGDMAKPSTRPARSLRTDYCILRTIPTRWADNDHYGHVNNVVYYQWFDTAVNAWLIDTGSLVLEGQPGAEPSPVVGLVVDTGCSYFESISFPDVAEIGIAVSSIGRSSVTYAIGVFRHGDTAPALAQGHFTHVYVNRASQTPVPIPEGIRARLEAIRHNSIG
jgi:acyl-CoA thioester hydrolase